jgi:hypothetical protein
LTFHNCKQKCGASEKGDGNCHVFANSRWAIQPPLLLADGGYFVIPSGFPIPFKNCPDAFQKPFNISQRLSNTLLAVPSGCPTAFESISQRLLAKMWQLPSLLSEGLHFW